MERTKKLYTVNDIAERWGITTKTVTQMLRAGKLRAFRAGREWRVTQEALDAYERGERPTNTDRTPRHTGSLRITDALTQY